MRRRVLFADPPPLPADAPAYADDFAEKELTAAQDQAIARMDAFDHEPAVLRRVETAVGYPNLAEYLVKHGFTDPEAAEEEYRRIERERSVPLVEIAPPIPGFQRRKRFG